MTQKKQRVLITVLILIGMSVLFLFPTMMAFNIALQRPMVLGRYSLGRGIAMIIATLAAIGVLLGLWIPRKAKTPEQKRQTVFKIIALTVSILLALVFVDVAMRMTETPRYLRDGLCYHRQPNLLLDRIYVDVPRIKFGYPRTAPGYPDRPYRLTTDAQGFRNASVPEQADIVVLGDSFAEGSNLSDADMWWLKFANAQGKSVYNLSISGANLLTYQAHLNKYGLKLKPKTVLCMVYEGNDFRSSTYRKRLEGAEKKSFGKIVFKKSPVRQLLKDWIRQGLGSIGAGRFKDDASIDQPTHPLYPVAWLPMESPVGSGHYYAIDLKRFIQHMTPRDVFQASLGVTEPQRILGEIRDTCEKNGIELVVIYAPDKPAVLIDQMLKQVPIDQLKAFLELKTDKLPEPFTKETIAKQMGVHESVFRDFCTQQNIRFVSLTDLLKRATADGTGPTYFTYDQHWTPESNQFIAEYLNRTITGK